MQMLYSCKNSSHLGGKCLNQLDSAEMRVFFMLSPDLRSLEISGKPGILIEKISGESGI